MLRFTVIIPLVLSIAAFVISFLLVFAGHKEGFMEDYALVRLNTSTLGYDIVPSSDQDEDRDGIRGWLDDLHDDIADSLNDITNDIADRLSDRLGISQWYSIHLMTLCRGDFAPNATDPDPSFNVTSCSEQSPNNRVNLTEIIDNELQLGPLNLRLADINWPDDIEEHIDTVNQILLAIFIVYVLAIAFSGLAMLGAGAAFFLDPKRRAITLGNLILTLLASILLIAGSIAVTVGGRRGAKEITEAGEQVGVSAEAGRDFAVLSWVAFAVMAAAFVYWSAVLCFAIRERRVGRPRGEKSWRN